jgi:hypothetical protein
MGATEKNSENYQPGLPVTSPRFERRKYAPPAKCKSEHKRCINHPEKFLLWEIGKGDEKWIELTQDRMKWMAFGTDVLFFGFD